MITQMLGAEAEINFDVNLENEKNSMKKKSHRHKLKSVADTLCIVSYSAQCWKVYEKCLIIKIWNWVFERKFHSVPTIFSENLTYAQN